MAAAFSHNKSQHPPPQAQSGSTGTMTPPLTTTRVFDPKTDTAVIKKQGLRALEKFVREMELNTGGDGGNGGNEGKSGSGSKGGNGGVGGGVGGASASPTMGSFVA